ncbi:Phospholipase D beta 1 [Apostasia shenzhenica]|uniref:phospholipase D n=1 Tax=Apostasia shenzhenica TaxID=1088818 RepID=A0A2I0AC16_9ASPA|nr:Phospholipase D beta 1 [Apostasia shenzhenica]
MDGHGNPYPYYAYGYPPQSTHTPNPNPYQSAAEGQPPPRYLFPSNSFSAPPLNHSGPLQYPPPSFPSAAAPPPNAYDPYYYNPQPNPSYPYPNFYPYNAHPVPYPNSNPPSFHHYGSFSAPNPPDDHAVHASSPAPSATACPTYSPSPSSSSLYPVDDVLTNLHLSDHQQPVPPVSTNPPSGPQYLPAYGHHPSHSLSGSFSGHASGSPQHGSQHGSQHWQIVPSGGQGVWPSLKVLLLHGSLDIWVFEARNLPNMDMFSKTLGDMLGRRLTSSLSGKLEHLSSMTSDPYVSIHICSAVVGRTYVVSNSENPVWMQHFYLPVAHHAAEVEFLVKDNDVIGSQLIGNVSIPAEWFYSGEKVEGVYPILGSNGKPCNPGATLKLSIQYIPIERHSMYYQGVGAGPDYGGVAGTYFPLRKGGIVTLYQDAHVPDGCLPDIRLEQNKHYGHGKCWRDIFEAISQARRLIYIAGWSVFHMVRLVRDTGFGSDCALGDLLKSKSQEGVRVLLLVWDDPTSRSILGYQMSGVMATHDEETRRFFKHSSVRVLLCPRSAGKRHSWVKQQETGVIFTHHQKTVIVDADAGNNMRKVIAFVGGLDLCGGRYDMPNHPLFSTLQTLHKDDYHNPNFTDHDPKDPREGWHDLHSRIDGPAAYDVLQNFEERWLKSAKRHGIKKLRKSYDDALLKLERIHDIIGMNESPYLNDNDPETWHVQIFRSIDSNSVKGFPKDPKNATSKNLVCGKNVLIDMSIHTAYVKAIRAAQHFIYIENQYFLGSSYNWDSNKDLGANNLIPLEIALKIASKIKVHERFSAYIVLPMWPEGNPTGAPTQRILYWQKKTMQMMYETIYRALKEVGLEDVYEPLDYLNFFCLGNREAMDLNSQNKSPDGSSNPNALARKNRRFMIYVHSKGMIVDDEYVIVGSANINQRSLEGTRDTEIAMGAYQPQHTWSRKAAAPHGQIYGYRMSLWAEHIGSLEECFTSPESLECMRRIRFLGERNWMQYVAEEITEMKGHLLKYPVDVDRRGKVKPLAGCETFPDVGGNICGSFLAIQENLTI